MGKFDDWVVGLGVGWLVVVVRRESERREKERREKEREREKGEESSKKRRQQLAP